MPTNRRTRTAQLALLASLALLPACGQHRADPALSSIRSNPTVNLQTLSKRSSDQANNWAYVTDVNSRQLPTDLARALYIDRPHRLQKAPAPY
jgi:hypothetical protein